MSAFFLVQSAIATTNVPQLQWRGLSYMRWSEHICAVVLPASYFLFTNVIGGLGILLVEAHNSNSQKWKSYSSWPPDSLRESSWNSLALVMI